LPRLCFIAIQITTRPDQTAKMHRVKAYRGVVRDGVVVLERGKLPEGAVVTVTVGDGELVRATITSAFKPRKKPVRVPLRPTPST
jgi:hypothetical protein